MKIIALNFQLRNRVEKHIRKLNIYDISYFQSSAHFTLCLDVSSYQIEHCTVYMYRMVPMDMHCVCVWGILIWKMDAKIFCFRGQIDNEIVLCNEHENVEIWDTHLQFRIYLSFCCVATIKWYEIGSKVVTNATIFLILWHITYVLYTIYLYIIHILYVRVENNITFVYPLKVHKIPFAFSMLLLFTRFSYFIRILWQKLDRKKILEQRKKRRTQNW